MDFLINLLAHSLAFVMGILPLRVRWWLGCFIGWLWFDVVRLRRFTILKNLTIAFPDLGPQDKYRLARKSMRYLGYNFFEFLLMPSFNQKWLENEVEFHGVHHYEEAKRLGHGVLFMSLHMGNGDVGMAAMALKGWPLNSISKKFKNKGLNQFWFGVREKMGTRFIDPHGRETAFQILRAAGKNEAVIFVIDQFMGRPYGILTTFFGRPTGTAYGLALFAKKTKAPVVPVYAYRDAQFKTHVVIESPIEWEENPDKDLQITEMTQKYNNWIESVVRRHPEQWMWVHRRWKRWKPD